MRPDVGTIKYRPLTSENCRRESGLTKEGEEMINLLIELYDYPYGLNYYYIQDGEVTEFEDHITNGLKNISPDSLIYPFSGSDEEKKETASEIADYLESVGYTIEKIFSMSNGVLANTYTIKQ